MIDSIRVNTHQDMAETIEESLRIAAPVWPLQNTVGVNPFWFSRHENFNLVMEKLNTAFHTSLFMPLKYYVERLNSGEITKAALKESLDLNRLSCPDLPIHVDELIRTSREEQPVSQYWKTFSESEINRNWHSKVILNIGKYCAAYLDDRQSIARFPWRGNGFWEGWLAAQELDASMEMLGAIDFRVFIRELKGLGSESAIARMLKYMGFTSKQAQVNYMQRLIANVLGWTAQFKYAEWQRQLGYPVENGGEARDLLAVSMAYDFGLFCISERNHPEQGSEWQASFEIDSKNEKIRSPRFARHSVFQLALEFSYQKLIAPQIISSVPDKVIPDAQFVFCIDVRSEMLRRHIESCDQKFQTLGFAGFFGVPFEYKPIGESQPSQRLPVLLRSAIEVKENVLPNCQRQLDKRILLERVASFFRSLRKNSLSSFVYVEFFGILYIEKIITRTFLSLIERFRGHQYKIPHRFDPRGAGPIQSVNDPQKIDRAEAILRHMGLTGSFAPLVFILGHGSVTTNNAFGSSLDCGACGGHAGDINARFLVDLLNDLDVRKGISLKGIHIPSSTWFVAGVHETVTDEVYLLNQKKIPYNLKLLFSSVKKSLLKASKKTRTERQFSVSNVLDPRASRRSKNWSEIRPEWGLAGNACFIVAPRYRTRGVNLGSRSFLHDYDCNKDQTNGYKTLELIMTAPMVVTNWINMQYYGSTVAPAVFGSGNKILHNLVNEVGVVEGNGGDLRIGLPIQSVHDGKRFVHKPLRLSVFIEAPREEIERIIAKHEVVHQLINQEWLHLLQINPIDLKVWRRCKGGAYLEL
jgi:uncharacterized protein YbcC (UPF0753/DUF2309 family)